MSVLHRVDPELRAIVTQMPLIDLRDIPKARAALEAVFSMVNPPAANPQIERVDRRVPGCPGSPEVAIRMFRPRAPGKDRPCLVWMQGGGYVLTAPDLDDQWCEEIAAATQCVVLSVAWRRAPEHPYPAAHDDCYGVLLWARRNAAEIGVDPQRIVLGGASSGGGAAAGVALRARDEGKVQVLHQLLLYPMLDDTNTTRSSHLVIDPELWNRQNNERAWRAYLGDLYGTDRVPSYAAPARATQLKGLPPTTILTAELDLFVDENLHYAQRLLEADVPIELHVYPRANHGFDRLNPAARVSRRLLSDRDEALVRAFAASWIDSSGKREPDDSSHRDRG